MGKYRVVREERAPDEFVYVPQYKWLWLWSGFVLGSSGGNRSEFANEAQAIQFLREEFARSRPLAKPKVVWRADDESINWRAGSDTVFRCD